MPGPPTIGITGKLDVMRELLAIERERLETALRIERERKIVFPETTVIARDVERLVEKCVALELGESPAVLPGNRKAPQVAREDDEVDRLTELLNAVGD